MDFTQQLANPQDFIFIPTSNGLVSLGDRMNIEAFARKVLSEEKSAKLKLKPAGGVLNDVYLMKIYSDHSEKRIIVKKFRDWSGFKWFPLNLWSMGARSP